MKKIIIVLVSVLFSLGLTAQEYYKAVLTELYTYNNDKDEWELYQKNSDVSINVVVEKEFISFQAKTPSFYKIYLETAEPVNTKTLKGYRYSARDLKSNSMVKIDVLAGKQNTDSQGVGVISIINKEENFNFRFFIVTQKQD
jgi:hypothetical protein